MNETLKAAPYDAGADETALFNHLLKIDTSVSETPGNFAKAVSADVSPTSLQEELPV